MTLLLPSTGLVRMRPAPPALVGAALCLLVVAALALWHGRGALMTQGFTDTDDLLRLVSVRELLDGGAWYDRHLERLQPPHGLDLHWSRLVDGGIAGLIALATPALGRSGAETAVRTLWPLLWVVPAAAGALAIAWRLGGQAAMVRCGLAAALIPALFLQFMPGRIDHHGPQVALSLVTLAGAVHMDRRPAAGWVAGAATGLLLAVGLEALPFAALAGGAVALQLAIAPRLAPAARRYALALAAVTAGAHLAQTPPARWLAPACDMLAANLVAGVLVAAAGLLVACRAAERGVRRKGRLGLVALAGIAALAAYLGLDPTCARGPFAAVDPAIRPLWLDHVTEVQPVWTVWGWNPKAAAGALFPLLVAGPGLLAILAVPEVRRDPAWLLILAAAALAAAFAVLELTKGISYAAWLVVPAVAAALARADRPTGPALAAGLVLAGAVFGWAASRAKPAAAEGQPDFAVCATAGAFADLARLPPGLAVNAIDMGPAILAFTPHAAMSAPYHRMPQGIRAAHAVLSAPPEEARARLAALGASYVVICAGPPQAQPSGGPERLADGLARGSVPPWLEPIGTGTALRAFRVRGTEAQPAR